MADGLSTSIELPASFKEVIGAYKDALKDVKKELKAAEKEAKQVIRKGGTVDAALAGTISSGQSRIASLEARKAQAEARRAAARGAQQEIAKLVSAASSGGGAGFGLGGLAELSRMTGISETKAVKRITEKASAIRERVFAKVASSPTMMTAVKAAGVGAVGLTTFVAVDRLEQSMATKVIQNKRAEASVRAARAESLSELSFRSRIEPGSFAPFDIFKLEQRAKSAGQRAFDRKLSVGITDRIRYNLFAGNEWLEWLAPDTTAATASRSKAEARAIAKDRLIRTHGHRAGLKLDEDRIRTTGEYKIALQDEYAKLDPGYFDRLVGWTDRLKKQADEAAVGIVADREIARFEKEGKALDKNRMDPNFRIANVQRSRSLAAQNAFEIGLFNDWTRF